MARVIAAAATSPADHMATLRLRGMTVLRGCCRAMALLMSFHSPCGAGLP